MSQKNAILAKYGVAPSRENEIIAQAEKTPVMLPTVEKDTPTSLPTFNPAAVLASGVSPATGRTLLTGPVLLPSTTSGKTKTPESRGEDLEKRTGEMKSKKSTTAVGSTSYGRGSDPAIFKPLPTVGSSSYGVGSAPQIDQNKGLTGQRSEQNEEGPTFFQRAMDTVSGGLKGSGANMTNMLGTLRDLGQKSRDKQNTAVVEDYARQLEEAQRALDAALEDEKANPGTWSQGDIQSFYNMRDDAQRKYDAVAKVYSPEVQQGTIQGTYEVADKVANSSAKDIERAKEGLGTFGGMLVDAGASAAQMAGDVAGGALTGNGMIPFAMRAFGGGTQQARQDGADLKGSIAYGTASAAKEVFTEKMFNIALPFSKLYGGGGMDDTVERVIRKAVDKLASTDKGKKVMGGLLTMAASGVSEGLEELIGDWMEWQMPRIYGGDVETAQETLVNSLYDFAVGGLTGLAGGALSVGQYDIGEQNKAEITGAAQDAEAAQTQKTAPMEREAVKSDRDVYTVVSKLSESVPALSDMKPVSTASTQIIQPKNGKTMADRARGFFESIKGTVMREGFGEVVIDTRSVKDDLSHGVGAAKAAVIPTIPNIIREGKQIDFQENWKGRGYNGYVFAAPVTMDGKPVYVAAVVTQSSKNRFYLHEVVDSNGNIIKMNSGDGATPTSLAAESDAGATSPLSSDTIIPTPGDGVKGEQAKLGGEVSTGEPFIPTERERGIVDDRTPAEKAMVEEYQRRKAAQPVSAEPTYRMTSAMEKLGMEAPERPITDAGASEGLRENSRALYEAKKQLDKVLRDTYADEGARRTARGILDGVYTFEQAERMGFDSRAMQDIVDAMRLVRSYNAKGIKANQERTNWVFDSKIKQLINGSDTWNPPSVLSLNLNTMQRNVERMMDPATAKAINAELFDPVLENEAKRIRFCNNQLDKIRQFKLNTQESAMVQRVMEGKITEAELRGLGLRVETIYKAADTMTEMYATFYDAINDFLVAHGYEEIGWQKNYAPHQQMENLTKLQKYLQRLGFSAEVTELPTEIAGRTDAFKPGKQYDPFFQHRAGGEGDIKYDAVGGLESYINYMSNVLYHTDDIQKLRRFNENLRSKYADGYIREELDRLNDLQDRIVAGEDVRESWEGIQAQKDKLYEELDKKSKLGGFVSVLDDYTNILAGKQSKFDRAVESLAGRKVLNWGRNIQNAFARSAVMGNLSSAINQTVQLPQLTAEVGPKYVLQAIGDVASGKLGDFNKQSTFLTGKQGVKTVSALERMEWWYDKLSVPFEFVDDIASRIIVRSKYLQQVAQGADHATALAEADQYAARLVGSRMKGAKPIVFEQKNPITKLVTTFQLEVANGWEHIVHDLPMEIRETARTRGKAVAVKKTVRLLVAGQIAAFLANCLIKSITGREPVPFDGLGMAANYMASGYGMTKEEYMKTILTGGETPGEFDTPAAMSGAAGGVMDNLPYVSNVTTMLGMTDGRLPLPQIETKALGGAAKDAWTAATSKDEEERKAAAQRILPQLGAGVGGTLLSFAPAGNQIKKSAKGIMALGPGGVYIGDGDDKRLKYPVEQSAGNWVKGVAFGPSALPETNAYYAEGKKTLTADETKLYEDMVKGGADGQKVYDVMQSLKGAKERTAKVDVLLGYKGTRQEKEALFSGMVTETMDEALGGLSELGISFDTVLAAYKARYGLTSDKDVKTGDTVPLSLSKNKKAAVDPYLRGLTKNQREAVYKALGISEKVWSLPMGLPIKAGW